MKLFVPITKVDEEKRLVYGLLTSEAVDKSGEMMDYDTSREHFEAWSKEMEEASAGKNYGNLRSMHGSVAAGMFVEPLTFDDATKAVYGVAKVVDDAEWKKVLEGVYTGLSIGGKYVKRWPDTKNPSVTRYTAKPAEVSLVDNPALKEARFELVRADGTVEVRKFAKETESMTVTNEAVAKRAGELAKAAGDEAKWASFVDAARAELEELAKHQSHDAPVQPAEPAPPAKPEPPKDAPAPSTDEAEKSAKAKVSQKWTTTDGQTFEKKDDAVKHQAKVDAAALLKPATDAIAAAAAEVEKAAKPKDNQAKPKDAEGAAAANGKDQDKRQAKKSSYSAKERKEMAASGEAMKDGSYPIKHKDDLEHAVKDFGGAKNKAAAKRHITRRAKALGATDSLPDTWKKPEKAARGEELAKGLNTAARLCSLIQELDWLHCEVEYEAMFEADGSPIPSELKQDIANLCATLKGYVEEEVEELFDDEEVEVHGEELERVAKGVAVEGLSKHVSGVEKAKGKKVVALLAKAAAARAEKPADADVKAEELAKAVALNEELAKQVGGLVGSIEELRKKVAAIEAQPLPGGPARSAAHVVHKGDEGRPVAGDGEVDLAELAKTPEGREVLSKAAIIAAQSQPRSLLHRGQVAQLAEAGKI